MLKNNHTNTWSAVCDSCCTERVELTAVTQRDAYAILIGPYHWKWRSTRHLRVKNAVLLLCPLCQRLASVEKAWGALCAANDNPTDLDIQQTAKHLEKEVLPGLSKGDHL